MAMKLDVLGYSLYRELKDKGIDCAILAPTTMKTEKGGSKTQERLSVTPEMIAECLGLWWIFCCTYSKLNLDNSVKEYHSYA